MVVQAPRCMESTHHANELLINRLVHQFLHVTKYERFLISHAPGRRNSLSQAVDESFHGGQRLFMGITKIT